MRVIGVGDNVVDIYIDQKRMYLGGNALNFAVFASELGSESAFVGVFGDDNLADFAKATLKNFQVSLEHAKTVSGQSGFSKTKLENGDRVFMTSNKGGVLRERLNLTDEDIDYINTFQAVHFNINGAADEYLPRINGPKVIYDFSDYFTKEKIRQLAPYVDLGCFSVSHMELAKIKELCRFASDMGIETVLCTRGAKGALALINGELLQKDINPVQAIDTMGAGDSFITAFSLSLLAKNDGNTALTEAANFSAKQVLVEGSFGHSVSYKQEYNGL